MSKILDLSHTIKLLMEKITMVSNNLPDQECLNMFEEIKDILVKYHFKLK